MMGQARKGPDQDWGNKMLDAGLTQQDLNDSLIAAALKQSGGNVSEAARRIGMSRSQVSYWITKRGGERPAG